MIEICCEGKSRSGVRRRLDGIWRSPDIRRNARPECTFQCAKSALRKGTVSTDSAMLEPEAEHMAKAFRRFYCAMLACKAVRMILEPSFPPQGSYNFVTIYRDAVTTRPAPFPGLSSDDVTSPPDSGRNAVDIASKRHESCSTPGINTKIRPVFNMMQIARCTTKSRCALVTQRHPRRRWDY